MLRIEFMLNSLATDAEEQLIAHIHDQGQEVAVVPVTVARGARWQTVVVALAAALDTGRE